MLLLLFIVNVRSNKHKKKGISLLFCYQCNNRIDLQMKKDVKSNQGKSNNAKMLMLFWL